MINAFLQATTVDTSSEKELQSEEVEQTLIEDWQALSYRSLWELWDNDSDAIYDSL